MAQVDGQMMMDFTTDELIRKYRTEDRLRSDYIQTYSGDLYREAVPEGVEIIVMHSRYNKAGEPYSVYYRARLKYRRGRSETVPLLISEPDGDWPTVPSWLDGWIFPTASDCYYVRRVEK